MRYAILAILGSALLAVGCGTINVVESLKSNSELSLSEAIIDVAVEDAQAALEDANAHNDKIAAACWLPIRDFAVKVQAQRKASGAVPSKSGALLAIQKARNVLNALDNTNQSDIAIGCAALEKDMARQGIKLAAVIAALSHGVPPAAALPGLIPSIP